MIGEVDRWIHLAGQWTDGRTERHADMKIMKQMYRRRDRQIDRVVEKQIVRL